nr:hypothetical protein [Tanacetum cinerariifolium]
MQKRSNDVKARTTLLLALPDEHQLRFSKYKTTQELWAAILKTFSGNKATKKTQKNLLKQQYGNFKAEGLETLEQTFNRLQVIVSHLEFMEIEIERNDLNQKFLTSLALEWLMHTIVWRNRSDLDTISLDELYNHLKVYEPEVQKKLQSNSQNMAFISSAKNSSGNEEVNTARKKISIRGTDVAGFDKSKVECFNCHKMSHFARECRAPRSQDRGRKDNYKQGSKVEEQAPKALMVIDGDSGCSRHMTGNISYLSDYEPFDEGYVSFGQGGCKITGKGTIKPASADESMLWHMRLGHLNIKTTNRLVRHNLVRGLPSKCFDNDHTCVACLKGKHHKASCKTKLVNSVTKPLYTLHMDLFGPTSISSLNHKWYCLVETDDFSRFTWTFFLKTKDETSGILRNFITEIENLKYLKVKIIRCDNRGEFRNKEMNDFCLRKGIKREFSNARTPQVLVNKSQNKTPYELFNGRTPAIGFFKPFGCHVMILNTLDHLGKFDAKGDEGCFIRYYMSSKAFKVFNKRTKRVEENLHVDFLENKAIENGAGPNWLFDIDSLTNSMNYVPVVVAGTNSTNFSDTKEAAGQDVKKDVSSLRYIALPNWFHEAHLESSTSNAQDACNADAPESSGNSNPTATSINPPTDHMETLAVETPIPTVSSPVSTAYLNDSPELSMIQDLSLKESPNVWSLVDCPKWVRPIGTKWVLNNKKDERGIVIRNKVRLVAQGHTQEERINYDEVFTPAARIEAIRLFLAYASFMGFTVYQMDVKSAFLYGTIDEEVYVMQPPGFQDSEFPARVYKVEKAMYGLHQAPRAWYGTLSKYLLTNGFERGTIDQTLFIRRQCGDFILIQVYVDDIIVRSSNPLLCREFEALMHEKFQMSAMGELNFFLGLQVLQNKDGIFLSQDKYVGDILKKFGYLDVRSANTPMDKENPWGKDRTRKDVDLHLYRSMIGSLMYLTASRLDIMFVVCACARHQVTPKECHLHVVKRIFRYLKGHPKLGLWYPKESLFDLVAYSDSDYGGATQDRKSTTGGCHFLDRRLISWQCKKQTTVATSTTEAE